MLRQSRPNPEGAEQAKGESKSWSPDRVPTQVPCSWPVIPNQPASARDTGQLAPPCFRGAHLPSLAKHCWIWAVFLSNNDESSCSITWNQLWWKNSSGRRELKIALSDWQEFPLYLGGFLFCYFAGALQFKASSHVPGALFVTDWHSAKKGRGLGAILPHCTSLVSITISSLT